MPQLHWTATRPLAMARQVEQTPVGRSTMDAMEIDERRSEGPRTRSQSGAGRDKYAPFSNARKLSDMKELKNSSHASVSLLTPRVKASSTHTQHSVRRTSLLAMEQARNSAAMDVDMVTPKVSTALSKQVLTSSKFTKDFEAGLRTLDRPPPISARTATAGTRGASVRRSSLKPSTGQEPASTLKSSALRGRKMQDAMICSGDDGSGSRIMVYVRLRPMSRKERESGARSSVKIDNKRDVYLTEMALETDYLRLKRLRGRHFAFDSAFPDNSSQQEVYDTSTAGLVEGVLDGKNASVFCYGATGAGKTHTMLGTVQQPGVMVLALNDLFVKLRLRSRDGEHAVRLSYLEVYNESVRDLLSPGRPLVIREDTKLGIVAAGLTQFQAFSADEIMVLLHKGNTNRQTEPTRANETSSRSHAILQVAVEYRCEQDGRSVLRAGKLSLIDLAGSERALATDSRTVRSVEGANINRSLLALSSCINALVEGKKHIPFRNSKLTQLLKDSLGGACQTAMIANLSPSNGSFGETQNTLHWADRAKHIRTKGFAPQEQVLLHSENQDEQAKLLLQTQRENQMLKVHLTRLEHRLGGNSSASAYQATPSTPFTPMIGQSSVLTYRGEQPPQVEAWPRRTDAKTMEEKKIWELQRTVELLEMEVEKSKRDSALREEKMNASILALTHDHTVQLKRKDEVIRNLTQASKESTPLPPPVPKTTSNPVRCLDTGASPIKCLEKMLKQRFEASSNNGKSSPAGKDSDSDRKTEASEKARRYVTPNVAAKACPIPRSNSRSSIPKSEQKTSPRVTRRMAKSQQTPQQSPVKTPSKNPFSKCFSPSTAEEEVAAACRKRTFWDITNSPNGPLGSSASLTATGKGGVNSHLRQPGFTRRRTSPEQDSGMER